MGEFHRDLRELIEVNLLEEGSLHELPPQYRVEWPEATEAHAIAELRRELTLLLDAGRLAFYPIGRPEVVSVEVARSILSGDEHWRWPDGTREIYCMFEPKPTA